MTSCDCPPGATRPCLCYGPPAGTKKRMQYEMGLRQEGASNAELVEAMGWKWRVTSYRREMKEFAERYDLILREVKAKPFLNTRFFLQRRR